MKLPTNHLYHLIASYRRKAGTYNATTLKLFELSCKKSDHPKHWLAYAKFQRDINGNIDEKTLNTLNLLHQETPKLRLRITQLLLENVSKNKSIITPKHLPVAFTTINNKQDKWRHELNSFLNNKTIAIIGNGTSLLNSNLGESIDSHSVVCRFNNFPTDANSQYDTGYKTDIWVISPEIATSMPIPSASINWIILTGGDARFTLQNWKWCSQHLNSGSRIITTPLPIWSDLVKQFEAPPSAGVLLLKYLISSDIHHSNIHLYGFDKSINRGRRYHLTSANLKPSSRHAWVKERQYIDQLVSCENIERHCGDFIGVFTKGLYKNPHLKKHLNTNEFILHPKDSEANSLDYIAGWGRKKNTYQAKAYAKEHSINYYTLEDGFIHSMSQGRLGAHSWSSVKDKAGIFYDATQISDLEVLINTTRLTEERKIRAKRCLEQIIQHRITKYNNAKLILPEHLSKIQQAVLVIDQVDGDTSIPYANANKLSFQKMMTAAVKENPGSPILVKTHPDVINGKRKGCIDLTTLDTQVTIISDNINPLVLLDVVNKVYVVSSQTGFEALLGDKQVVCFGVPFYAGWGLTDDRVNSSARERRTSRPDLLTIFHCAYIDYSHYIHPETSRPCQLEVILDYVMLQNQYYKRNSGVLVCLGLTLWKRQFVRHYLKSNDNTIYFIKNSAQAEKLNFNEHTKTYIWSSRFEDCAYQIQKKFGGPIYKIEDGFIRSIGLGVNYSLPSSLAFDEEGIYFDPKIPSDLETILSKHNFSEEIKNRALKLIQLIIDKKISKYNGNTSNKSLTKLHSTKRLIVLVPGQVADDESIKRGCPATSDNLALLRQVRHKRQDAIIIYKPHPDVVNGYRKGSLSPSETSRYCDFIIDDINISDCLGHVDEVHTMTSLVGFEALLRGVNVYCYGIPFYAGWGLTTDECITDRRSRKLSLEELVAGTLLLYPRYYDWQGKGFTTPESLIDKLSEGLNDKKNYRIKKVNYLPQPVSQLIQLISALLTTRP